MPRVNLLSLSVKLILAFVATSLLAVGLVGVLARQATAAQFDQFIITREQQALALQAEQYYAANGTLEGWTNRGQRRGQGGGPPLVLLDANGIVINPVPPLRRGQVAPPELLNRPNSLPVTVDGEQVATIIDLGMPLQRTQQEQEFIRRIDRLLLTASIGAGITAIVIAAVLTRMLTRPIQALTKAAQAIQKGDLDQKVHTRSKDEIGALVAAFNQMSADLARANMLRDQMTADIAHELRTPLTVISGYLQGMLDGTLEADPERLAMLSREVKHLQRLVEDLRTLSLADAGTLRLERKPVSIAQLLTDLHEAYAHRVEAEGLKLRIAMGDSLPVLSLDPTRIAQVLGNMIANALRYTPPGGQIVLSAEGTADGVRITVSDNGSGIPPEKLPHIFERFYQADPARASANGQSGLGLAIARSLVEAHGGSIRAESVLQQGTTMIVELPQS